MMNKANGYLDQEAGLQFYKLMGSGKSGFSPWPDWSVYALIMVWDSDEEAQNFIQNSTLFGLYRAHSEDCYTLYLQPTRSKGQWSGTNPFAVNLNRELDADQQPIDHKVVVLTRATIKTRMLYRFWKYVPISQQGLRGAEGLLFVAGIGEVPLTQMCTFTIWTSTEALEAFAYKQRNHQKAITLTRSLDWYQEELFCRFIPLRADGTWRGEDLLRM